ncbi:uncharacterized protein LOC111154211 [Enhydra lutris kenyoni]|uniref:Uncharacterized protein LOC111154211 n=1 Tax=Enhydra lutris kenyoni TaxID=391180 RepID=A0A2Y9KJ96_ENHLU|nr:uncharacterized protein LOC111154211 [Enhydra lutris kenyoni]XP_022369376.1 uncharacterized protein LOC111154211 [Enhydra lutris kenyoni]
MEEPGASPVFTPVEQSVGNPEAWEPRPAWERWLAARRCGGEGSCVPSHLALQLGRDGPGRATPSGTAAIGVKALPETLLASLAPGRHTEHERGRTATFAETVVLGEVSLHRSTVTLKEKAKGGCKAPIPETGEARVVCWGGRGPWAHAVPSSHPHLSPAARELGTRPWKGSCPEDKKRQRRGPWHPRTPSTQGCEGADWPDRPGQPTGPPVTELTHEQSGTSTQEGRPPPRSSGGTSAPRFATVRGRYTWNNAVSSLMQGGARRGIPARGPPAGAESSSSSTLTGHLQPRSRPEGRVLRGWGPTGEVPVPVPSPPGLILLPGGT